MKLLTYLKERWLRWLRSGVRHRRRAERRRERQLQRQAFFGGFPEMPNYGTYYHSSQTYTVNGKPVDKATWEKMLSQIQEPVVGYDPKERATAIIEGAEWPDTIGE